MAFVGRSDVKDPGAQQDQWERLARRRERRYACTHLGAAAVFRPGIILADSRYAGQLNAPDIFTRRLFSLVATGVAPRSFYQRGDAQPHYEGLPVDFLAESIAAIGPRHGSAVPVRGGTLRSRNPARLAATDRKVPRRPRTHRHAQQVNATKGR